MTQPQKAPRPGRGSAPTLTLADPTTPFLAVDRTVFLRNVARLTERMRRLGVRLRPHVKTPKSVEAARLMFDGGTGPITVSTLAEADAFVAAGFTDVLYAVGIDPGKFDRVRRLQDRGADMTVLLDSTEQAAALAARALRDRRALPALIEIDCDGHRAGLQPGSPALIDIGTRLAAAHSLAGVLVHAGGSYHDVGAAAHADDARRERDAAVGAAETLRAAGLKAPIVSVGSTPTAHAATDLTGVTEVRAGNFVFFDLVMAGIDVCTLDDLALSCVVTVIGHQRERGWILTDGGWMAVSRDRGTAGQRVDQGYGLVCDLAGRVLPDLIMSEASQEHGTLTMRPGSTRPLPELPLGTRLRILPNHACAMAAQHPEGYAVIESASRSGAGASTASRPGAEAPAIVDHWSRVVGW